MRSGLSAEAITAIEETVTHKFNAKLTVFKSRAYFNSYDDNAPSYANIVGDTGTPVPEAVAFIPSIEKVISVVANEDGNVALLLEGSSTSLELDDGGPLTIAAGCRPGIFCDWQDSGSTYIFWYDGSNWRRAAIDVGLVVSETADCVSDNISYLADQSIENGAIYPVSREESIILSFDEGGIRPYFIDSDHEFHISPARFFDPVTVLDPDTTPNDIYLVHFGGAAKVTGAVFAYVSAYDGSVKGIKYTFSSNNKDGSWSDIQMAVPQDLSIFQVGNVFAIDDRIFLCGRFSRREEFATETVWTLLAWSDNGFIFSMDRRILCTGIDLRFVAAYGEGDIVFSSTNRTNRQVAPYQLIGENTDATEVELLGVNGGVTGEFTCRCKAGNEQYLDIPYMNTGSYCLLDIGVFTGSDYEYVKYHDMVISGVDKGFKDGMRTFTLQTQADGFWHTSNMTYPFYMEFQGRQGVYDPALDFSNFFKASTGMGPSWTLTSDFWIPENDDVLQPQTHPGATESDWWGPDLLSICTSYPEIGPASTFEFRIYGWSRAGVPDTNPNTADPTPTDTNNDEFFGLIEVQNEDNTKETIVCSIGELSSAFANPPQSHFPAGDRDGSYPVVFDLATPGEGKKIIRLGVRVVSDTGNTVYYLERVEMPGISCNLIPADLDTATFDVVTESAGWKLVDTITFDVTEDNDDDGDHTNGSYVTSDDRVYAVVFVGYPSFKRSGISYKQDAAFETHGGVASIQSAAKVLGGENPLFADGSILWDDSVPPGTVEEANHNYVFHIDQSVDRHTDSSIPAKFVPYVYGNGDPFEVEFHLAGSGAISNLENPTIIAYVFESPEEFSEFQFYGVGGGSGGDFQLVAASPSASWVPYPAGLYSFVEGQIEDFQAFDNNLVCHIKNPNAFSITIARHVVINTTQSYATDFHPAGSIPSGSHTVLDATDLVVLPPGATTYNQDILEVSSPSTDGPPYKIYTSISTVGFDGSLVPVPSSFSLAVPGVTTITDAAISTGMVNRRKGIPQIIFSSRPYSAFNFESIVRYSIKGAYSYAGLIGLGTDEKNFVLGYIRSGEAGIATVRAGKRTTIVVVADDNIDENTMYDVRFWHRDGLFGLEYKEIADFWPQRGSMLLHEWEIADGPLAVADDVFHLGAYSHLDPPRFRITGFRSSQDLIGVQPLDIDDTTGESDFQTIFPESGVVDIDSIRYNYSARVIPFTTDPPLGPYGLRNITNWQNPFNKDPDGSHSYQGGKAIEFTQFNWFAGSIHYLDFASFPIASSAGYAWINQQTMFKAWITTGGQVVLLRNRARHYSTGIPDYYQSADEKIWITNALSGVSLANPTDQEYYHPSGTFCYYDSNDEVRIYGFIGTSGDHDQSIMTLLRTFCEISGTHADFPGDFLVPFIVLDDEESVALSE